jgi:signal transduction histidine kinase
VEAARSATTLDRGQPLSADARANSVSVERPGSTDEAGAPARHARARTPGSSTSGDALRDLTPPGYIPRLRAVRLIASGRVVLAAFSLLGNWIDPYTPDRWADATYLALSLYVVYAVVLAFIVWRSPTSTRRSLIIHGMDLAIFGAFQYLTEGSASPFFVYFTFALVSATLRWRWHGAVWTTVVVLAMVNLQALSAAETGSPTEFEVHRLIIRNVYLAVVGGLLAYLGAYHDRLRVEISRLSTWPSVGLMDPEEFLGAMLRHTAGILRTPRVLLVWDDPDEPWCRVDIWSAEGLQRRQEALVTYEPLVAEALAGHPFICADAGAAEPVVLHASGADAHRWRGVPLHPALQSRFGIRSLLYLPVRGQHIGGHLLALDRVKPTEDDLELARVVGRLIADSMDHLLLARQRNFAIALSERVHLAEDLHDGVMQSLTAAAFQLEAVSRQLDTDPSVARKALGELEHLLIEELRDLRLFVRKLRPPSLDVLSDLGELKARLGDLVQRFKNVWNLPVALEVANRLPEMPGSTRYGIFRLVQEALVNVARHAQATKARVVLAGGYREVLLVVADDGHGFPFRGFYSHNALRTLHLGPASLQERVSALGGTLDIDSTIAGARLEIRLPLAHAVS